jgi:alkylation response protein AidB-like acyl-CoA dehydrogenase
LLHGGEWLIQPTDAGTVFTPERLNDEQRMIVQTVKEFVANEVLPALDRLEQKDWAVARELVRHAASLGLLGVDVPEAFGGLQLDKTTSMLVSEWMAESASFGATYGAHVNLMVLPLTLFGSEDQKRRYLPKLLTGETIGAYCLSEPGSGSDALGAKASARRQPDGSFVLNGEKMWITNGGFADVYIVFAKLIDDAGEHFTGFIVERSFSGVSSGKEEHKMGLHGSSTTPVILQDVHVPAENLLGEIGKGHKIAFNVLNFARFKLGAMCVGGAQGAIGEAARYAGQRKQFGQPIASFGAIKHKLGEMIVQAYAMESLVYRTAGIIDARIESVPHDPADQSAALATFEEYAVEASIAKVAASEMLDFVLDENIQIHGGNGFVRDYPAERRYRDSRVNRIFEGTNEINRLLIPTMLARRAAKGTPAIIAAAKALQAELAGSPRPASADESTLAAERRTVEALKKAALLVFATAMQTYGQSLADQQEVLMHASNMLMDRFCGRKRRAACDRDRLLRRFPKHAARVGRASVRQRCRDASRCVGTAGARDDAERRGARHLAGRSATAWCRSRLSTRRLLRRELADDAVARGTYPMA